MAPMTLPFAARLDAATGDVEPQGPITERRVSDLQGLVADEAAWRAVDHGNPIVYRVVAAPVPRSRASCRSRSPRSSRAQSATSTT